MTYRPYKESWPALLELDPEAMRAAILVDLQRDFEDGNNSALLDAVEICLNTDTKAPDWVQTGFKAAWGVRWESGFARTLDDAFNIKRPKNWTQNRFRKDYLTTLIWQQVVLYMREDTGEFGSRELCELVAEKWNGQVELELGNSFLHGLKINWTDVDKAYKAISENS